MYKYMLYINIFRPLKINVLIYGFPEKKIERTTTCENILILKIQFSDVGEIKFTYKIFYLNTCRYEKKISKKCN